MKRRKNKQTKEETVSTEISNNTEEDISTAEALPKDTAENKEADTEVVEQESKKIKKAPDKDNSKKSALASIVSFVLKVLWILFALWMISIFVAGIHTNSGLNMEPSLCDRDVVIYYRLAKKYDAHDIVVYDSPTGKTTVGRIIAKPGDTVEINERGLKINGYYQTEDFIKGNVTVQFESAVEYPLKLKDGEYFILNDNRTQGGDSRIFGALKSEHICGRVVFLMRFREF